MGVRGSKIAKNHHYVINERPLNDFWPPYPHSQTPKMSIFYHIFFHVSALHEVRHLVSPWLLRSSSSPPTVRCLLINLHGQWLFSILRSCPYHFNCLLWILSKIDCSACILFLIAVFGIFCNHPYVINEGPLNGRHDCYGHLKVVCIFPTTNEKFSENKITEVVVICLQVTLILHIIIADSHHFRVFIPTAWLGGKLIPTALEATFSATGFFSNGELLPGIYVLGARALWMCYQWRINAHNQQSL